MRLSISKGIFYLLLTIPISFKIEISKGISFFPQEIFIPILLLLFFGKRITNIHYASQPYVFFTLALLTILFSTILSQFSVVDFGGLLRTLKYLFYVLAFIVLPYYSFDNFTNNFNKVALLSVMTTLFIYFYQMVTFSGSLSDFISLSIWDVNYVASGLSNFNFNLSQLSFSRSTGNHGIYGSFLVLIYMINVNQILEKKGSKVFSICLIILSIINLLLLNSRETLLLLLLANSTFIIKPFFRLKIKRSLLYIIAILVLGVAGLLASGISIGLIEKVTYTIESITTTGGENNMTLRFAIWNLILKSFLLFPFYFFIGYGYNSANFEYFIKVTNRYFNLYDNYATVPENIFLMFLSYGGIIALFFFTLFYVTIVIQSYKMRNSSSLTLMFYPFVLGLFITNNTGGSLMSDLFLTQFTLVYIWLVKQYGQNKNIITYSAG